MPWKEEPVVAEGLCYLPEKPTAQAPHSRSIPDTSLNFFSRGRAEFTVDLAKLAVFHTRGNWKFSLFFSPIFSSFVSVLKIVCDKV